MLYLALDRLLIHIQRSIQISDLVLRVTQIVQRREERCMAIFEAGSFNFQRLEIKEKRNCAETKYNC